MMCSAFSSISQEQSSRGKNANFQRTPANTTCNFCFRTFQVGLANGQRITQARCLVGYGAGQTALRRRLAQYVARILRGASADELPIEQPTTFVAAINLKTARGLALTIPCTLLARADEVIE
jgi:ABC transporter substrate binding protein